MQPLNGRNPNLKQNLRADRLVVSALGSYFLSLQHSSEYEITFAEIKVTTNTDNQHATDFSASAPHIPFISKTPRASSDNLSNIYNNTHTKPTSDTHSKLETTSYIINRKPFLRQQTERRIIAIQNNFERACAAGCQHWLTITVNYRKLGIHDVGKVKKLRTALAREITGWLYERGLPVARVTCVELSQSRGAHTHELLACPDDKAPELRDFIARKAAALAKCSSPLHGAFHFSEGHDGRHLCKNPDSAQGWLRYVLKGCVSTGDCIAEVRGPEKEKDMICLPGQNITQCFLLDHQRRSAA